MEGQTGEMLALVLKYLNFQLFHTYDNSMVTWESFNTAGQLHCCCCRAWPNGKLFDRHPWLCRHRFALGSHEMPVGLAYGYFACYLMCFC